MFLPFLKRNNLLHPGHTLLKLHLRPPFGVVWREPESSKSRGARGTRHGGYTLSSHPLSLTHYTTAKLRASRYPALPLDISTFPPRQTRPEMTSHTPIDPTNQAASQKGVVEGKFEEREIIRSGRNRGRERVVLVNEEIRGLRSGR